MAAEFEFADGSLIDPQLRPDAEDSCEGDNGPRDLLPWADPYIARLVRQHQLQCRRSRSRERYDGEPSVRFAPRGESAAAGAGTSARHRAALRR